MAQTTSDSTLEWSAGILDHFEVFVSMALKGA